MKGIVNVNRKDIQCVGGYFPDGGETYTLEELLRKIEMDLGYDSARGKRLITECERNKFVICIGNNVYTR